MNYTTLESELVSQLGLSRRPVAISMMDAPPEGVAKFEGAVPSGCSFWRLAASGNGFYTEAADHYNCPIGSYTHSIDLPENRANELTEVLGFMGGIGYVGMEEVPGIPRLETTPKYVLYAPLSEAPVTPDVVLLSGAPGKLMLLNEAAIRAGAYANMPLLPRPTCMAIPASLKGGLVSSTGCIGNRVYTDIADDDLYVAFRGSDLEKIVSELRTISQANAILRTYHEDRRKQIATV